jgi:hypothetical protein
MFTIRNLFILLIFISTLSFSQERKAKLIFTDSTEVKGFGEIINNKIFFRVSLDSTKTKWSHEDLVDGLQYYGNGFEERFKYILPDKRTEKPLLMEIVEEGSVNLYKGLRTIFPYVTGDIKKKGLLGSPVYVPDGVAKKVIYYVKRNNENYATDISFSFKSKSLRYFKDCNLVTKKIKSKEFRLDNVENLVFFYNEYCSDEEEIIED